MRRFWLFIPLIAFVAVGVFFYVSLHKDPSLLPSARIDKPFPVFQLPDLNNPAEQVTEKDFTGSAALVNVWATWCPTCKQEHAFLDHLKNDLGITIYGVDFQDDPVKARQWLEDYGNPYARVTVDEKGTLGTDLGVYGAPETYVVNAKGIILYRQVGAVGPDNWPKLEAALKKAAGETE